MLLFLFGSTEAYQLLKLPLLVKHYVHHKRGNPELTVVAFLKMHYPNKIVVDADFQQDMQLPFKTNGAKILQTASVVLPAPRIIIETIPAPLVKQSIALHQEQLNPLQPSQDIFQPPRCI